MNQYIYKLKLKRPVLLVEGPTSSETKILQQHGEYLSTLAKKKQVLLAGRTQSTNEDTFGIVIFTAATETDALAIMNNDPAVKHGVMSAKLYPYQISFLSETIGEHTPHILN